MGKKRETYVSWIQFTKSWTGLSASMTLFEKVNFYVGVTDHWGFGFQISFYDRSFTLDFLRWYLGFEIWHKKVD